MLPHDSDAVSTMPSRCGLERAGVGWFDLVWVGGFELVFVGAFAPVCLVGLELGCVGGPDVVWVGDFEPGWVGDFEPVWVGGGFWAGASIWDWYQVRLSSRVSRMSWQCG